MKKLLFALLLLATFAVQGQNRFENRFTRPLGEVLTEVGTRFGVQLKIDAPIEGLYLPYADFRIRPYSLDETLTGILGPFDFHYVREGERIRIKAYEYNRRTGDDGRKLLAHLETLYTDRAAFERRAATIRREVRERLELEPLLAARVEAAPILSKVRRFDGYTVQNFALQTLPGLYVCGSIYAPAAKGKHPVIVCPNGHFGDGRYRKDQQQRLATLARMGALCVDYDLFGYGESELQVTSVGHRTSYAQQIQALNGIAILDMLLARADADDGAKGLDPEYATAWSYGKGESFNMLVPDFMGGSSADTFAEDGAVAKALKPYGMLVFVLAPGAFIALGYLMVLFNKATAKIR